MTSTKSASPGACGRDSGPQTLQERILVGVANGTEIDLTGDEVEIDSAWLAKVLSGREGTQLHPKGLILKGATIAAPIDWTGWSFLVSATFHRCTFKGQVTARRLHVAGALSLEDSTTTGLDLWDARVEGNLNLDDLEVNLDEPKVGSSPDVPVRRDLYAVRLHAVRVTGSVCLDRAIIYGGVGLLLAVVEGQLQCHGAKLHGAKLDNEHGVALTADTAKVTSCAFFDQGFESWGGVSLTGAEIGAQLSFNGAKLNNERGNALSADWVKVTGNAFFDQGFESWGGVSLAGAEITGYLSFNGAKLHGAKLNNKLGAALNNKLGAALNNKLGAALIANGAKVTEDVSLGKSSSGEKFLASGTVSFAEAELRSLLCDGARLDASATEGNVAFNGRDMVVRDRFEWKFETPPSGKVVLTRARAGELCDDVESWPADPGSLDLSGFVYEQFGSEARDVSAERRVKWVQVQQCKAQPCKAQPCKAFAPQPYTQLAAVYKAAGNEAEARRVLIDRQRDLGRFGNLNWFQKAWNLLLGTVIGYGYLPRRAAYGILFIYLLSVFFVWQASDHNDFLAVGSTAAGQHLRASQCTDRYPCLSAWEYPIDAALPVIELHQVDYWQFDANTCWGHAGRDWTVFATVAGWGLTTLLVVGLSSLVRDG